MRRGFRLCLITLLAVPFSMMASAEVLTPTHAKKCEHFASMSKSNVPVDSDDYGKIHDIQVQWRKLAALLETCTGTLNPE